MKYLIFFLLLASCSFHASQGFELLSTLTEQTLCKLLKIESLKKDSLVVGIIVPRSHCKKVLGYHLNTWVTSKGASTIDKQNLYLSLSWEVLKDTSTVRLILTKIKK